jgi:hypothetical protein
VHVRPSTLLGEPVLSVHLAVTLPRGSQGYAKHALISEHSGQQCSTKSRLGYGSVMQHAVLLHATPVCVKRH